MPLKIYKHNERFELESGEFFPEIEIAYTTYGELNDDKSNVIWICHAFTANSDPTFYNDRPNGGANGLKTARSIALISYRNAKAYNRTQQESSDEVQKDFKPDSY